jgi:hypothetical protein
LYIHVKAIFPLSGMPFAGGISNDFVKLISAFFFVSRFLSFLVDVFQNTFCAWLCSSLALMLE